MTGCLHLTPADDLPIIAGIQPAEPHCNGAALSLACRAVEPGHLPHSALTCPPSADARRLKSRHLFVPAAQQVDALGRPPMERGVGEQPYKTTHFYPRHPPSWNNHPKKSLGLA